MYGGTEGAENTSISSQHPVSKEGTRVGKKEKQQTPAHHTALLGFPCPWCGCSVCFKHCTRTERLWHSQAGIWLISLESAFHCDGPLEAMLEIASAAPSCCPVLSTCDSPDGQSNQLIATQPITLHGTLLISPCPGQGLLFGLGLCWMEDAGTCSLAVCSECVGCRNSL